MSDEHDIVEATSNYEATTLGTVAPTNVSAISSNSQETSKKLVAPTAAGSTYLEVGKINSMTYSCYCVGSFKVFWDNFGNLFYFIIDTFSFYIDTG